jgi:hypothetical protein
MRALKVVADALNDGELPRAQIAALLLRLPDPPALRKSAANGLELAAELADSGILIRDWDPDEHPRAGGPPNPGWFAPKDSDGTGSDVKPKDSPAESGSAESGHGYAFAGTLMFSLYDEVIGYTHCWYSTPIGQFAIEKKGYVQCPATAPAPF